MNADEQALRDLVALWHHATAAGDVDTVLRLMAEDVVFLVAGHPPMRGRSSFEQGLRGLLAQHRIESTSDIQEIEVSGSLAYCWNQLTVRVIPRSGVAAPEARGSGMLRTGSALSVFCKQPDGTWLLVRDANLLAPAP